MTGLESAMVGNWRGNSARGGLSVERHPMRALRLLGGLAVIGLVAASCGRPVPSLVASRGAPSVVDMETARRNAARQAVVTRNSAVFGSRITRSEIKRSTWSQVADLIAVGGRAPSLGVPPEKAVYVVATAGELRPASYLSHDDPLGSYKWQIDVLTVEENRTLSTFARPRAGDWPALFDGLVDE